MDKKVEIKKKALLALKIGIGSFIAIYVAELMHLSFAPSAGIVTLLTTVSTKWETVKLSAYRVATFFGATAVAVLLFRQSNVDWLTFGVFMFVLVFLSGLAGLSATVSVNAVIGTHYLTTLDFSLSFIMNEFMLVLIGTTIAIIFNLFQPYRSQKGRIIAGMRDTETSMQAILEELGLYLKNSARKIDVWSDIKSLEERLSRYTEEAYEYQDNTFVSHPEYYIYYFEMRTKQANVLHNLHYEMKEIRNLTEEANVIADFIFKIKDHVHEMNDPEELLGDLKQLIADIHQQPLPTTREEFACKARLYHILMDVEDLLVFKKRFLESLEDRHFEIYWNKEK